MPLRTIEQLSITGKRVLVRAGLNVPLGSDGEVKDDYRLRQAAPTIRHAAERKAKVIVAGHLGRPKAGFDSSLRMALVAPRLAQLVGRPVATAGDCIGGSVKDLIARMQPGDVLLLENLRFHRQEETNDSSFAGDLASMADVYVNDAFSASHRNHASIVGVAQRSHVVGIGFLMEKEIESLSRIHDKPESPFVAILGGSKVPEKLKAIRHFLTVCDYVLLGGVMGLTMLRTAGVGVGRSQISQDVLDEAKSILSESRHARASLLSVKDHLIAETLEPGASFRFTEDASIPVDCVGCDLGPKTVHAYTQIVRHARTIFWNGPLGACEIPPCDRGTNAVAEAVTAEASVNVAGGGDTVSCLLRSGQSKSFTHLSTGGGAALKFLVEGDLPGLAALRSGPRA